MITQAKQNELRQRMEALEIREEDLQESFVKGSGRGGQKINKSSTCVRLKHLPTGIEVKSQKERSREMNRFFARRILCEKIEEIVLGKDSRKQQEIERIRRQKGKRAKRAKDKKDREI
ncbi:MAG: peptide chain release factor-like protein [Deltaproteobacteria bacterium]|nr:peptide chain release factor-like protein [Deltaproteobacteria bacterium]